MSFKRSLQRPGAKLGIVSVVYDLFHCSVVDCQHTLAAQESFPLEDIFYQTPGYILDIFAYQPRRRHHSIDPIEEFGLEELLCRPDVNRCLTVSLRDKTDPLACLSDPEVRRHDYERIAEIRRPSERVGQPGVAHYLEQQVEDIGMSFFD